MIMVDDPAQVKTMVPKWTPWEVSGMSSHLTVDTRKLVRTWYTSFSGGDREHRGRVALAASGEGPVVFLAVQPITDRTDRTTLAAGGSGMTPHTTPLTEGGANMEAGSVKN